MSDVTRILDRVHRQSSEEHVGWQFQRSPTWFLLGMESFPSARHENGANLSFADGHVEHWRWKEAKSLYWEKYTTFGNHPVTPGGRDLSRLHECIPHARP